MLFAKAPSPITISESSGMGVKSTSSILTKLLPPKVKERNSVQTAFQEEASWKQFLPIVMVIKLVLRDIIKFSPLMSESSPKVTSSRYLQPISNSSIQLPTANLEGGRFTQGAFFKGNSLAHHPYPISPTLSLYEITSAERDHYKHRKEEQRKTGN